MKVFYLRMIGFLTYQTVLNEFRKLRLIEVYQAFRKCCMGRNLEEGSSALERLLAGGQCVNTK